MADNDTAVLRIGYYKGYLSVDVIGEQVWFDTSVSRIPLVRNGSSVRKTYYAFWGKNNSEYYIEEFAQMLKSCFSYPISNYRLLFPLLYLYPTP